jgi:hypothetical protein
MYAGVPITVPTAVRSAAPASVIASSSSGTSTSPREPRDAPVEHQRLAELPDHHVGGLEIAVHDPAAVGVRDGVGDLHQLRQQPEPLLHRLEPRELLAHGAPAHPLHRVELRAVAEGPDLVDGDDARVLQLRGDAGLAGETGAPSRGSRGRSRAAGGAP